MSDISDVESLTETTEHESEADRKTRNRERNKEHARRTRLRKKEQLDGLKARVHELEEEGRILKQQVDACNVASILIGLSEGDAGAHAEVASPTTSSIASQPSFSEALSGGKRKRFLSIDGEDSAPPPMELNVKGHILSVGGSGNNGTVQMNWKTGTYFDKDGKRQRLTDAELKALRRERNRMHAKMTRDRKKCFLASLNRVIAKLEEENRGLREVLARAREQKGESSDQAFVESKPRAISDYTPAAHSINPFVPINLQESSANLMAISNSSVINNEVVHDGEPEAKDKNNSVPPNVQESSAALMYISNSRIFTIG